MVAAAVSTLTLESNKPSPRQQTDETRSTPSSRPPLLPSERGNGGGGSGGGIRPGSNSRRPRGREIPSRYLSSSSHSTTNTSSTTTTTTSTSTSGSSTLSSSSSASSISRRFPSPLVSRTNNPNITNPTPKRSVSVDRRRSVTPKPPHTTPAEPSAASKLLVTSTRSLSVSFQGQAFSLPVSKTKAVTTAASTGGGGRKSTPERRRSTPNRVPARGGGGDVEQVETGSKPLDQHRWPARNRQAAAAATVMSRSSDYCTTGTEGFLESSIGGIRNSRRESYGGGRASFDGILSLDRAGSDIILGAINSSNGVNLVNESGTHSDLTASDTDSVSSESTSGAHDNNSVGSGQGVVPPRGIVSSARFWQETNMKLRRLRDSGSVSGVSPRSPALVKPMNLRKFSDGPMMSPRAMSSPIRGAVRAASPSKLMATTPMPVRGISPSRMRSSISRSLSDGLYDTPSVLSYVVDVRRGKVGENKIIDAHQLRVLYNRQLQWRFVNARAEAALLVQKQNVQKNLWNAWITITGLRDSVRQRRAQLQLLRQKLKLTSILKGQVSYLEEWSYLDQEHSSSMQGAIEALKASTLRLPVIGGAIVDMQSVKDAVGSAVDVMQAMSSSLSSLLNKVEEVNCMVVELANLSAKETALMRQCKDVLSAWTSLEVKDCSLRANAMQLNRLPIA